MGLSEDFELIFSSGTTIDLPVDPEELLLLFPDAPYVEILELIQYYTLEVNQLIPDQDDRDELSAAIVEYIKAAVACALSRLYDPTGLAGGVGDAVFRLGDLSVERRSSGQGGGRSSVNRINAQTWCELAAVLREELIPGRTGAMMKSVVRSSKWCNPMPCREIREKEDTPLTVFQDEFRGPRW
jgi:hypothetical protein